MVFRFLTLGKSYYNTFYDCFNKPIHYEPICQSKKLLKINNNNNCYWHWC